MRRKRLLRITTVPQSLVLLLEGQLKFMMMNGFELMTASAGGEETRELRAQGIQHRRLWLTRTISPLIDAVATVQTIWLIWRFRPDIVHTHTPKAGLIGMLAAWLCRVPARLHTVAGLPLMEATGLKRRILLFTERLTYKLATRVYPNSKGLLDYISTFAFTGGDRFRIIGNGSTNGVDSTRFLRSAEILDEAARIRATWSLPPNAVVYCFAGRLVRDKGIRELVHAFRKISVERPSLLVLLGRFEQSLDPLDADSLNFIQNSNAVVMAGFQRDIRPWLTAADVFVFPSYREGFPNVVMQAACLEVPCIATDINGSNEIIRNNVTGLLVPVKDPAALYEAMCTITSDRNVMVAMGRMARDYVSTNFDQKYLWKAILQEYNNVTADAG
jgi:glycosyltransferase involved in cell wall biosynthesis